jgi:TRAP-type C4-dicarboxylate transport system substrate-binding protein
MKISKKLLAATCLAALVSGAAWAQDITMRLGSHIGPTAPGVVEGYNVFAKAVGELTDGSVKIEVYPGEQAGKALQMYDLVKVGAVDLGGVASGYVSSDKLPLIGVLELPGLAKNVCSVTAAITKLGTEGGLIYENDIKPQGMRVLAFMPYPPYGPAVSRTELNDVSDLLGQKMRNAGGLMERTVDVLGGVPVKMPSPEIYQGLQRGTLDSVLLSFLSIKSLDLASVADYGSTGYSFGTPGDILLISEDTFQSLSPEHQAAFIEAGNRTAQHWCAYVDGIEAANIEGLRADGLNIHTWTDEQVAELNEKTKTVGDTWAKSLESMGKPAKAVIDAFVAELNM